MKNEYLENLLLEHGATPEQMAVLSAEQSLADALELHGTQVAHVLEGGEINLGDMSESVDVGCFIRDHKITEDETAVGWLVAAVTGMVETINLDRGVPKTCRTRSGRDTLIQRMRALAEAVAKLPQEELVY
jgi:hypothetical protein